MTGIVIRKYRKADDVKADIEELIRELKDSDCGLNKRGYQELLELLKRAAELAGQSDIGQAGKIYK